MPQLAISNSVSSVALVISILSHRFNKGVHYNFVTVFYTYLESLSLKRNSENLTIGVFTLISD